MPEWKKNIFVNAIKVRMEREGKTAEELIDEYNKLTDTDKAEILSALEIE